MADIERSHPSLRAHLIGMLGVFAALFLGLTVYLYFTSRSLFAEALQQELSGDLEWIASMARERPELLRDQGLADSLCKAVSRFKGFRLTLIATDGRVLAESYRSPYEVSLMDNHASRPEIEMAKTQGRGHSWRNSTTVGLGMLYVAQRLPDGEGYLRLAAGPTALGRFQTASLRVFALFLALFLAASCAIIWWISRKISSPLLQLTGDRAPESDVLATASPPRWDAAFSEAEVLNRAFSGYVDQIRNLGGEVEKQRDKLASVLNQLEEGILILSAEGKVVTANPSSLKLLGADPGTLRSRWLGRPLREILPQSLLAGWVEETDPAHRPPFLHVDKGPDAPFDLLCHLAPLDPAGDGASAGRESLLTLINVTEFRHLDRVKSEFVANASHELKTPLSSIKGFAEALLEGALDDGKVRGHFVKKIHANALRLERLVQDLLSLSRLEANTVPKETEPLPLRGYVNAAAVLHRDALQAAGVRLENHVPEDVRLLMEPRDLELILNNLVANAVKYNKPGGKVKLWTEFAPGLRLCVKDTGVGIPAEMLPRIFERFYRAGASRASKEGTGLGLAIVKHAAAKYGMTVSAESVLEEGSRFIISIPEGLAKGGGVGGTAEHRENGAAGQATVPRTDI